MTTAPSQEFFELDPHSWSVQAGGTKDHYVTEFKNNYNQLGLPRDARVPSLTFVAGYGELDGSIENLLAFLADQGVPAVAPRITAREIPGDRVRAEGFAHNFGPEAIQAIQDQTDPGEKATAVGHSMGGAFTGMTLREAPELIGNVGLAEAASSNTLEFRRKYPNAAIAEAVFTFRLLRVATNPFYKDTFGDKMMAGKELGTQLGLDALGFPPFKTMREKFSLPPNNFILPDAMLHAAMGNTVVISQGAKDILIRKKEVEASKDAVIENNPDVFTPEVLAEIDRNLHWVTHPKGNHMHIASNASQENLVQTLDIILPNGMRIEIPAADVDADKLSVGRRAFAFITSHLSMDGWYDGFEPQTADAAAEQATS